MANIFSLTPLIGVHETHLAPVEVGSELYRVIYEIYTDPTSPSHKIIKFYEVWVSQTYIEDKKRMNREPTIEEIRAFANQFLKSRYDENNGVPPEDGAFLTNEPGEILGNPSTFPLRITDRSEPVKTTIMLPKETHKWLKVYALENETGLSEVIRRIVMSFVEERKRERTQQNSK